MQELCSKQAVLIACQNYRTLNLDMLPSTVRMFQLRTQTEKGPLSGSKRLLIWAQRKDWHWWELTQLDNLAHLQSTQVNLVNRAPFLTHLLIYEWWIDYAWARGNAGGSAGQSRRNQIFNNEYFKNMAADQWPARVKDTYCVGTMEGNPPEHRYFWQNNGVPFQGGP